MTEHLPAPIVPADVDLRDFAFMPLDVVRLRDSDLAATPDGEVFRAAVIAWCVSWHQLPAASLPDDDAVLARLLGYGRDVKGWLKLRAAGALHGFVKCSDGRLYHPDLSSKAIRAWQEKLKQQARVSRRLEIVGGIWDAFREAVFKRDDYTCQYCGARGCKLECDHVLPRAQGGKTDMQNLKTACQPCNRSKGNKTPAQWRANAPMVGA